MELFFAPQLAPLAAASGSEDGTVRLWDLISGACVHKLEGHDATVVSLTCTTMYVVSTGMDDRLCIWERCKGHLLHWIQMVGAANFFFLFNPLTLSLNEMFMIYWQRANTYCWNSPSSMTHKVVHLTWGPTGKTLWTTFFKYISLNENVLILNKVCVVEDPIHDKAALQ